MDLKEESISSEQVYSGALLHAYRDTVRLPDGTTGPREWLDHPGAAAVVPIFPDGSVLLVRQFRFAAGKEFLEIPAGKLDIPGESPEQVARRELQEETGWVAGAVSRLGAIYPCIGYSNEIIYLFIADGLTRGQQKLAEGEFVEPVRMPFDEAVAAVVNGQIDDAKSSTALLLAAIHLKAAERRGA